MKATGFQLKEGVDAERNQVINALNPYTGEVKTLNLPKGIRPLGVATAETRAASAADKRLNELTNQLKADARYQHLSPTFLADAVGRLDAVFGELSSGGDVAKTLPPRKLSRLFLL